MKDDGGPAFPGGICKGMSMRDWFAGMAMNAYMSHGASGHDEKVAAWSYELADAMLRARGADDDDET